MLRLAADVIQENSGWEGHPWEETLTRFGGRREPRCTVQHLGAAGQQALGLCLCLVEGVPALLHFTLQVSQINLEKPECMIQTRCFQSKNRCTRYMKRHRTFFRVYSCRIFKQIS